MRRGATTWPGGIEGVLRRAVSLTRYPAPARPRQRRVSTSGHRPPGPDASRQPSRVARARRPRPLRARLPGITVVSPPTAAPMTGVPVACASAATRPTTRCRTGTATRVAAAPPPGQLDLGHGGNEAHHVADLELRREERTRGARGRSPTARPRRDGPAGPQRGALLEEDCHRTEQHVGKAFNGWTGRRTSTRERRPAALSPTRSRRWSTGRNTDRVDAGVHHLDPAGIGVVEVDQLLGLDVGVGDEHVGGLDHLIRSWGRGLGVRPPGRRS